MSSAVEQLWQTLSENELALVCVRIPECEWADLMTAADHSAGPDGLGDERGRRAIPARRWPPRTGTVTASNLTAVEATADVGCAAYTAAAAGTPAYAAPGRSGLIADQVQREPGRKVVGRVVALVVGLGMIAA